MKTTTTFYEDGEIIKFGDEPFSRDRDCCIEAGQMILVGTAGSYEPYDVVKTELELKEGNIAISIHIKKH